tara:strand:+ start:2614 stop:2838 length:225 start_codon:yes stop_codon:yes gene_type:complete
MLEGKCGATRLKVEIVIGFLADMKSPEELSECFEFLSVFVLSYIDNLSGCAGFLYCYACFNAVYFSAGSTKLRG